MATTTKKASAAPRKAGRPQPQDRLPKAEARDEPVEVEVRGHVITVDPDLFDDYDAMSMFGSGLPDPLLRAMVPDNQTRKELLDTCIDEETGKRRLSKVMEMVGEIVEAVGAGN